MTITDKLNEIEEQTKMLAEQAHALEKEKKAYEGLLECEVHDHEWKMESAQGNLREIHMIELHCGRCGCWAIFAPQHKDGDLGDSAWRPLEIYTSGSDDKVADIIPEEDE